MRRSTVLLFAVMLHTGCVARRAVPPPASDWHMTLSSAHRAALEGRFPDADQALATFADRNPGSAEARESAYWRALFLLDPANRSGSPRGAVEQLDRYLSDPRAPRVAEARVMRGLAMRVDSLGHALAAEVKAANERQAASEETRDKAKEEELQKENQQLKEQLDKATQELDRIKRRLAPGKP